MKALTHAQVAMLKSIRDQKNPFHHLSGRSEHGGGRRTLASLYTRGLLDRLHPVVILSVAGEKAINEALALTTQGASHE